MVKLFSVTEMKSLEKEANQTGLTYETMMENAGQGIAKEIDCAYRHIPNKKIFALVGSGNNGGDALVALSYLAANNWVTCAYLVGKRLDDDPLIIRLKERKGCVISVKNDNEYSKLTQLVDTYSVLLDGVLGTGFTLPLSGEVAKILSYVKLKCKTSKNTLHIVAVDCPSGVDCDTGEVSEESIPAEITITMAGIKDGLIKFPAADLIGDLRVASIGSIENLNSYQANFRTIINGEMTKKYLPTRPLNSHKGTYGTALIIAGSVNFTGAALLAGLAAYRIGTGLVTMAVPAVLHEALSGNFPEATWILLPQEMGVISQDAAQIVRKNIRRATALLCGPGMGIEDTTEIFINRMLTTTSERRGSLGYIHDAKIGHGEKIINVPMVMDADGLKLLSKINNWSELLPSPTVLTPHPGEMAVLTGLSTSEIQGNRIEIAKEYSIKWRHVVVLKGAYTVIADPTGKIAVVPVATPALAKAGTGDVLAGLIVGLLAQGVEPFQAASAGAWIHANAGIFAAKKMGNTASVIASDVLNAVPQVISDLQ